MLERVKFSFKRILLTGLAIAALLILGGWTGCDVSPTLHTYSGSGFPFHSVSGRPLALTVSSDGQRLYAGTYSGIWRSDDAGVNWYQLTYPEPPEGVSPTEQLCQPDTPGALCVPKVVDVEVSQGNKDVVFAATGPDSRVSAYSKSGIYRSEDGGETWKLVHQFVCPYGGQVGQITIAPDKDQLVYAAGGCAIAISEDGGNSWKDVYKANDGTSLLVWHVAPGPEVGHAIPPDRIVYAAGDNQMWYSPDAGDTWFRDQGTVPGASGGFASDGVGPSSRILAVDPQDRTHVYLATLGPATGPNFYFPVQFDDPGLLCNTTVVYDQGGSTQLIAGSNVTVGLVLKYDRKITFVDSVQPGDTAPNGHWDPGETLVFDYNGDNSYDADANGVHDFVIVGSTPKETTPLSEDPKIKFYALPGVDKYGFRGIPSGPDRPACGGGTLWLGDYSRFDVKSTSPMADWKQLPGPPQTFNGGKTPGGTVYVVTSVTPSGYLVFFSDTSDVYVSDGRPDSFASWHRLDGGDVSTDWCNQSLTDKLYVHVDPHALAVAKGLSITLRSRPFICIVGQGPEGIPLYQPVPSPYNQNSQLESFDGGTIWMANDGGVFRNTDGGSWKLGDGLSILMPLSIAGLARQGQLPALYMGTQDNDNFSTRDGGTFWEDPVSGCGDCDRFFADPQEPWRVLELAPRDDPPGFGLYVCGDSSSPCLPDPSLKDGKTTRYAVPFPSNLGPQYYPGPTPGVGYNPVVAANVGDDPGDGDYILLRNTSDGAGGTKRVLLRTTQIRKITKPGGWDTYATQQGPDFLPEMKNALVVKASGGRKDPFFFVGDPQADPPGTMHLWVWHSGQSGWQQIVPSPPNTPLDQSAQIAQRFFVDPYNPAIIYIIDQDAIKRSHYDGNTWTWERDINLENQVTDNGKFSWGSADWPVLEDMVFDRSEPNTRFAVGAAGVFFTLDGTIWQRLFSTTALPGIPVSAYFDPISDPNNRVLYVAFYGRGVMRFTQIPPGPVEIPGPLVAVPNVKLLSEEEAEAKILDAGLTVGQVERIEICVNAKPVPRERVVDQYPAAGTLVPVGTPVNLVVFTFVVWAVDCL